MTVDSSTVWVICAFIAFVLISVVVVLVSRSRRSEAQKAFDQTLKETKRRQSQELKTLKIQLAEDLKPYLDTAQASESEYSSRVSAAEKELASAQRAHARQVKIAEKALKAAEEIGCKEISSIRAKEGKASFTGRELIVGSKRHPLSPEIDASVDATGSKYFTSRTTATRVIGGAVLAGPAGAIIGATAKKGKVHDDRELYLSIAGPNFAYLLTLSPNDGQKARTFASNLIAAARQSPALEESRSAQIHQAKTALSTARHDTAAIESARENLSITKGDCAQRDRDKKVLDAEQARADAVRRDLEDRHAKERDTLYESARAQHLQLPRGVR